MLNPGNPFRTFCTLLPFLSTLLLQASIRGEDGVAAAVPSTAPASATAPVPATALTPASDPDPDPPSGDAAASFEGRVQPFVKRYCAGCHGNERRKAGLNLEAAADASAVLRGRKTWEKVVQMLLKHEMPPEEKPQPPEIERDAVVRWIQGELGKLDCGGPVDPGHSTIRRLNRTEYAATIRDLFGADLLGADFQPAAGFPADEVGYGFDNMGDVLSLPPLLVEKYLDAAEGIVDRVLQAEDQRYFYRRFEAEVGKTDTNTDVFESWALSINREGEVFTECDFTSTADYIFRVRAWGQQAGPEPTRLSLRVDGREIRKFDVDAEERAPGIYQATARIEAGRRKYSIAYTNNYVNTTDPDPARRGDRNLLVDWFEAERASDAAPAVPPARGRIIDCRPADAAGAVSCSKEILARFARRAYRRPVPAAEIERLTGLVRSSVEHKDSFEEAIALALKAILVSPRFLFRLEDEGRAAAALRGPAVPIDGYELASRLSYFLWSTMPDEELFRLAGEGRLQDDAVLEGQVTRMLADPRSAALAENFAGQWLQTRYLDAISPDPKLFPSFNEALRQDMKTETRLFFEAILKENRGIIEFLDADFTFLNERLARHYGIAGVQGDQFRRVALTGGLRGGLLTQASILTLTSNPTRTSPVKRGKWILEQILGEPPPPPPPAVPDLSEEKEAILSGTLRQRMEKHRMDPNCAVCHQQMDSLGFAFENYDATGAWREFDGPFLIDPAGELPGGRAFKGPEMLKAILKSEKEAFSRALVEKLLTYALGRGLEYYDKCAVDKIVARGAETGYNFTGLIQGVVKSLPFRFKRGGATAK